MRAFAFAAVACLAAACSPTERPAAEAAPHIAAADPIAMGRYITLIGGCNDCHTQDYAETGGNIPEGEWLKGDRVGQYGPWGTSYASNLRLVVRSMGEDDWVQMLKTREGLPIMPWNLLPLYRDEELRAVYRYIAQLPGDPGPAMPTALPPGQVPPAPYSDYLTHRAPPG